MQLMGWSIVLGIQWDASVIAKCALTCHVARRTTLSQWTRPNNVPIVPGLSIRQRVSVIDWRSIHYF